MRNPEEILQTFKENWDFLNSEHSCCFNDKEEMTKLRQALADTVRWAACEIPTIVVAEHADGTTTGKVDDHTKHS